MPTYRCSNAKILERSNGYNPSGFQGERVYLQGDLYLPPIEPFSGELKNYLGWIPTQGITNIAEGVVEFSEEFATRLSVHIRSSIFADWGCIL